jgi:hypothetical protein
MNSHSQMNLFIWRYVIIFVLRANWRGYSWQLQPLRLKIETTLVLLPTGMGGALSIHQRGQQPVLYTSTYEA